MNLWRHSVVHMPISSAINTLFHKTTTFPKYQSSFPKYPSPDLSRTFSSPRTHHHKIAHSQNLLHLHHKLFLKPRSRFTMTVTRPKTRIEEGRLLVNGRVISTGVPSNVVLSPATGGSAFVGGTSSVASSRHVFSLGVLEKLRFLSLFRFKIWWMIPRVGELGSEIPMETQFLLLEVRGDSGVIDDSTSYVLLLPVLNEPFRASLEGAPSNELQFCVESGDSSLQTKQVSEALFINAGHNPFELIRSSIKMLAEYKGTFTHIDHKKVPAQVDGFGWCTWDAFYKDVNPEGIKKGIQSFMDGGCPPKFLIIDDGWQDTVNEFSNEDEPFIEGTTVKESDFAMRLVDIKENSKFRGLSSNSSHTDLRQFVTFVKEKYGLEYVFMWHALVGYWGGVLPSSAAMQKYNPKIVYPKQSPGNVGNVRDVAMDSLEKLGVGLIDPEKIYDFYNDLHSYLASCGVDGVKVDVQCVLETLGYGYGGRVSLTRKYQHALEQSVLLNFKDNNTICCMSHNSDSIYSLNRSSVARASEDFMPRDPTFQTLHVASVAFNSLLLGEIVVPDWDMFHSKHNAAEFHAAARAIGGCAVYVSDKPGEHDFGILRKLVLPDGSILRARCAGRPTRDCLFTDPVMDKKSLLKIWNMNKFSGVIGVFNCQGEGNWPLKQGTDYIPNPSPISGHLSPLDVEFLGETAGDDWNGECAVFVFHSGSLLRLPKGGNLDVSLATLQSEIFTIVPIRVFNQGRVHFAPIGLLDMYNSGGAIEALSCVLGYGGCKLKVKVRGCGRFGAYSNLKPRFCTVEDKGVDLMHNVETGLLTIELDGGCNLREIEIGF